MTQQNPNQNPIPAEPLGDDNVHRPADDHEEIYFSGSPLLRGEAGALFVYGIIGLVLIAIPIALGTYKHPLPIWITALLVLIAIIIILIPVISRKTIRYRITNYRIDYERGVLSKDIDTMELWHVEDLKFHQSLLDRLVNVGTIEVLSHDDTNPRLFLMSLPNPRPLFDQLKQRIIAVKRQRGVIKVDSGT